MTYKKITDLVIRSSLPTYNWKARGRAPIGYLNGMAIVYARVFQKLLVRDPIAMEMAKPVGSPDRDAFAWYKITGPTERDRLRLLFAMLIGLGMRESSGNFGEGRDMSANNVTADTAEAGLFQMSWDITKKVPMIKDIFTSYNTASLEYGLAATFHEAVRVTDAQLANYGTGAGCDYQYHAKARPAFAVEAAAVGLRNCRRHWGPINRREVEILADVENLLRQVEAAVTEPVTPPLVVPTPTIPSAPVYTSIVMRIIQAFLKIFGR